MTKATTLTLKIVNDESVLDSLPKERPLTEAHKELIRFIARVAVQEYLDKLKNDALEKKTDRILRLREVMEIVGLSRSSIYQQMNQGNFPKSIKLGQKSVGWKESQITAWLNQSNSSIST